MKLTLDHAIQLTASILTLAGMFAGTTNLSGITLTILGTIVWWVLMLRHRLWGLLPLNVGGVVIECYNAILLFH